MTTYIVKDDKKMELLERNIFFEEGEGVFIQDGGGRTSHKVANIRKVLIKNGDNFDVALEIYLT